MSSSIIYHMTPLNVGSKTRMESKAGRDTDWMALPAPAKPVKKVTIQTEEDPVDQVTEFRRNESIISLEPMDLSKSAGLNDLFNEAVSQGSTMDPDWPWLSMIFDDEALELSASFSSHCIAPSPPKPSAAVALERTGSCSQPAVNASVAAPV
jgi:hypothetical protein